jgi:D-alanine-D-alanine ligase
MRASITKPKTNVGIIFGGESAEHDVSIMSARSVLGAIDRTRFTPYLIGVDRTGRWHMVDEQDLAQYKHIEKSSRGRLHMTSEDDGLSLTHRDSVLPKLDVIFPLIHGPKGEDGSLQGLLELMNMPYVGPNVLSSAVGMDKDMSKRLLREAGIPVADHLVLRRHDNHEQAVKSASGFDYPLFVKPANLGSSIGVSKVRSDQELLRAIQYGFRHDRKVIIEQAVVGDEIECAVLGYGNPAVSVPGRIIFKTDFYDYDAKYDDSKGTELEVPADLSPDLTARVQATARHAYQALECEGLARVDMFVTASGDIYVNEVNTLPGFTKYSMYPKLWEATGLPYRELITKLIHTTLEKDSVMDTSFG